MIDWRSRAATTRFAVLSTTTPSGRPHAVPIVHAVVGDRVVSAVDHKPKTTTRLARLRNIDHQPRVCVLFDSRSDDWSELWWVRADGIGTVTGSPAVDLRRALIDRHPQYRDASALGPWIVVDVDRWTGWAAS